MMIYENKVGSDNCPKPNSEIEQQLIDSLGLSYPASILCSKSGTDVFLDLIGQMAASKPETYAKVLAQKAQDG